MKSNYLKFFIASAFCIFANATLTFGQWSEGTCGNYQATQALEQAHPELVQQRIDYDKALSEAVVERKKAPSTGYVYIIPIVFHIMHVNGPENISDAQIIAQVAKMNTDWRKLNSDTTSIVPSFVALAADVEIEFRLAKIDPNGNCTNGIDRIYSHTTFNADESCKINQWPRDKYMNVWVVSSIGASAGVAGYALYPSSVATFGYPYDGVVILASVCNGSSRVLTHEIAHCFSLQHTFGDTNNPGTTCADDLVADTPITKGHPSTCPLTDAVCDPSIIENVQNYMEYATCPVMFTYGQRARMQAALNSPVAERNHLWINSNLIATGTNGAALPACVPRPDFYANTRSVCPGGTVVYTKNIQDGTPAGTPATKWTFPGGTPSTSTTTASTVSVTYSTPGSYDVKLWAKNTSGADSLVKTSFIYVSDPFAMVSGMYSENFDNASDYYSRWSSTDLDNDSRTWWLTNAASYSSPNSIEMNAYYSSWRNVDQLFSPSMNLSFVSGAALTFRCAAATKATTASDMNDKLVVSTSINCGVSWLIKRTFTGAGTTATSLINNSYHPEEFLPNSSGQWALLTVPGIPTNANVRVKFEYTSGYSSNSIYIDDINITGTLGVNENSIEAANVSIYPNPTNQTATLSYHLNLKGDTKIELIDVLGKKIMEVNNSNQAEGDYNVQISKNELKLLSGVYFVKFTINNNTITKKLIITE